MAEPTRYTWVRGYRDDPDLPNHLPMLARWQFGRDGWPADLESPDTGHKSPYRMSRELVGVTCAGLLREGYSQCFLNVECGPLDTLDGLLGMGSFVRQLVEEVRANGVDPLAVYNMSWWTHRGPKGDDRKLLHALCGSPPNAIFKVSRVADLDEHGFTLAMAERFVDYCEVNGCEPMWMLDPEEPEPTEDESGDIEDWRRVLVAVGQLRRKYGGSRLLWSYGGPVGDHDGDPATPAQRPDFETQYGGAIDARVTAYLEA